MKKATVAILLALSTVSSAQEPPSSTTEREHHEVSESSKQSTRPPTIRVDRPSFANSSHVVGAGVHSLESGVLVTTTKQESHALVQAPLLYRVGINQELEFRLGAVILR